MAYQTVHPATNRLIASFPEHTEDQIQVLLEQAESAFGRWRRSAFSERKALLLKCADRLRQNRTAFSRLITLEMGKRIAESEYEIDYCARIIEFYAKGAEKILADQPFLSDAAEIYLRYEPIGPLLGIMPWNFPFYQAIRFAAPNMMAGNTILLKHAGIVPQCALALERLFKDSGLPEGVYQNVFAPTDLVGGIIADDRIRGVSLTGSAQAGMAVAAEAGRHLKKSVLELGGNDVFMVLDDADLEHAAKMARIGRMINAGQSCIASKRFIVAKAAAERFIELFKAELTGLKMGDPFDPATELAPLSSEQAAGLLDEAVKHAVKQGGQGFAGRRPGCPGRGVLRADDVDRRHPRHGAVRPGAVRARGGDLHRRKRSRGRQAGQRFVLWPGRLDLYRQSGARPKDRRANRKRHGFCQSADQVAAGTAVRRR